jgi:hypothetical protein
MNSRDAESSREFQARWPQQMCLRQPRVVNLIQMDATGPMGRDISPFYAIPLSKLRYSSTNSMAINRFISRIRLKAKYPEKTTISIIVISGKSADQSRDTIAGQLPDKLAEQIAGQSIFIADLNKKSKNKIKHDVATPRDNPKLAVNLRIN